MTTVKIYHNPRCSKSREALALLQEKGLNPIIINYLQNPPTLYGLKKLQGFLGASAMEMVRDNESEFEHISALEDSSDEAILSVVEEHPKLLQRPIIVCQNRAVIGRPPEKLLEILDD